jgi:hypothetical protein
MLLLGFCKRGRVGQLSSAEMQRNDSPEFNSITREVPCPASSNSLNGSRSNTFTGKLKTHCPSFFNSLTTLEKLTLDNSSLSGSKPCNISLDPTQTALRVTVSSQDPTSYGWGSAPLADPISDSVVVKPILGSVRDHTTWSEPRVCVQAPDTLLEVEASVSIPHASLKVSRVGEASGGTEHVLLSDYREDDPSECSLGETLESLIPLIREVDATVPLTIHQGSHILSLLGSTDLVNLS